MSIIILLTLLIITFFSFWRDKKQYIRFKSFSKTEDRQRFYRRWTIEPFLLFGISSLIVLWYLGQLNSLIEMPYFLKDLSQSFMNSEIIDGSDFLSSILKGLLLSLVPSFLVGSTLFTILREYQNKDQIINSNEKDANFRNLEPLIPINYKERLWGAILSINAGFSEEIFFRLLVPILIYNITGSIFLAIFCSTLWFGLAHFYQGIGGVLTTFIVGLLLFGVYIITQSLWIAMIVHAVIDINGLVLSPWLRERFAIQKQKK